MDLHVDQKTRHPLGHCLPRSEPASRGPLGTQPCFPGGPAGGGCPGQPAPTCTGSQHLSAFSAPCRSAGGSGPCGSAGGHAVNLPGGHSPVERPQVTRDRPARTWRAGTGLDCPGKMLGPLGGTVGLRSPAGAPPGDGQLLPASSCTSEFLL